MIVSTRTFIKLTLSYKMYDLEIGIMDNKAISY